MVQSSPAHALGNQADGVRELIIDVVRTVHDRYAAAHLVSGSKYGMVFGSQWRDLLDETHDALKGRGFESYSLPPGGHKVGIVNDCLIYVWRVPEDPHATANFAASPTRQNGFLAPPPPAMLWEPTFREDMDALESSTNAIVTESTAQLLAAVGDPMPVVLVMVRSVPGQLQRIEWAVAELDVDGKVKLHGEESIWEPEFYLDDATSEVEPFDSGTPSAPVVELRAQDWPGPDA